MRFVLTAVAALGLATPAAAEFEHVQAEGSVAEVLKRLKIDVVEAGATVFAEVDHGAGAESVGTPIGDNVLLIFGNPQLGTPVLLDDPMAGLVLPLKLLVYADDDGQTWIAYETVDSMFDDLDVDGDATYVETMEGVLQRFVSSAAEE